MESKIESSASVIRREQEEKSGILNLNIMGLTSLPEDVKTMTWLVELHLIGNDISSIEGLDLLVNLEHLHLIGNRIEKIQGLGKLTKLKALSIGNQISKIERLERLQKLEYLSLGNQITKIEGLNSLKKLKALSLMNNQIQDIGDVLKLPNLVSFDLTNNKIESLHQFIPLIERGFEVKLSEPVNEDEGIKVIYIGGNRISDPPIEIIQQGREAILKYFEERNLMAVKKLDILKVILVGNSQVGKSNFSQFLRQGVINDKSESTHILDIQKWDADFLISEEGNKTRLHLFDFGGQDYYHDAHRMYYSHDTAYVLLWDTISNEYQEIEEYIHKDTSMFYENFPLAYWLQSINYTLEGKYFDTYRKPEPERPDLNVAEQPNSSSPPILVIQNKIDIANGKLNQEELSKQYVNIWGYFGVSLLKNKRTDVLKELLSDYLHSLNLTGRILLMYQYKLVQHFSNSKGEELIIYSLEEFKLECVNIIQDASIVFEERDAKIIAHILNNIGVILFYEVEGGGSFVFSNINLLNEQIKKIMDYAKKGSTKGVFLKQEVLDDIDIRNDEQILELLCGNKSIIRLNDDMFLAPQFLPTEPDKSIKFFLHTFNHLQLRYVYPAYYHKSILLNLFANYLDDIKDTISLNSETFPFWRNGIIVSRGQLENKEMVFIEFIKNKQNAVINIKTMQPFSNKRLEGSIVELMDKLNRGWTVTKEVSADSKIFIQIDKLLDKYRTKQFEFVREDKRFRINDFKELVEFENRPKRIFISYSSLDKEYLKQFTTQIVSLRNEGLVETWDDRELQAGDKWDIVIKEQLEKADYVILFITANFLNSEYIKEVELKNALQQQKGLIPIIIDYCTWTYDDTLKSVQVLNKEQPLTAYSPISKGWVEVIKALKAILEKPE